MYPCVWAVRGVLTVFNRVQAVIRSRVWMTEGDLPDVLCLNTAHYFLSRSRSLALSLSLSLSPFLSLLLTLSFFPSQEIRHAPSLPLSSFLLNHPCTLICQYVCTHTHTHRHPLSNTLTETPSLTDTHSLSHQHTVRGSPASPEILISLPELVVIKSL